MLVVRDTAEPATAPGTAEQLAALARVRHVALDMDGTIYKGGTLFGNTLPFLALLDRLGIGHTFLTNNSSKSTAEYLVSLAKMGIPATAAQLYSSTASTIEFLAREYSSCRQAFILGTPGLQKEFAEAGIRPTADNATDEPDVVIVGFDTGLRFERLCRAAYWIKAGKPFIATHPDRVCPTDQPTVLVDCGAVCAALREATGCAPVAVLGKPDPLMLSGILARHGLKPSELAMVGDRLYTDMAMAHGAGAVGILVLTGEATQEQARAHKPPPDFICSDLAHFGKLLVETREA